MCGIAGFIDLDLPDPQRHCALMRMTDAIAHRGPDGSGAKLIGRCGLGHRRLSIIDLKTGAQPMSDAEESLWLTYNGEIFNYRELRDELIAKGHSFRTSSDSEVIIEAYRAWGPDCVTRFNGDFAFAIWDVKLQRLMLARDRIGVRPLHYARRGATLVFASEAKALLGVAGIDAALDPLSLDQIFTSWATVAGRTVFKGIDEVPPGHVLLAGNGIVSLAPYWRLVFPRLGDASPDANEAELREELRALLTDATRLRLRADVPVGSYLSGGLDSSLTTALGVQLGGAMESFSVTFDDAEYDESAFQQMMAAKLGTRHHARACSSADIAGALADVVQHAERPILRTAPAPLLRLAESVRANGIKVVLTGEGADEVFGGYDIFKEAKLRRFVLRQPGSHIRMRLLARLYPYMPRLQTQSPAFLNAFFVGSQNDHGDPLFSHLPRFRTTSRMKALYSAEMKAAVAGHDPLEALRAQLPAEFAHWHPLNQAQYLETTHLLPGYILSAQGDRMAMAHSVEGRFPFLDHRVVEFAAKLPPALKLRGLTEKHLLREAARDLLPAEIADRPKQPYRAPEGSVFFAAGAPLGGLAPFSPSALNEHNIFDTNAVGRLVAKAAKGGALGFADNAALVGVATTGYWQAAFGRAAHQRRAPRAAAI